ncbi:MAG: amidohydrolase [Clostridia bacterium]|nr:amidohydrolase [Clostridia bacterium]
MNYYERASVLGAETVEHRRFFHTNAEVGLYMPKAKAYVMAKLKEYGLEPEECGEGVTAAIGKGGRTILLRADMDALPMEEESGLEFACPTGTEAHACGHDLHAAMLLTAAKLLKEDEAKLEGVVRFMFQPAEETLEGAKNMIEHGILDPMPDAALAFHVAAGRVPAGTFMYNGRQGEAMMFSVDGFNITVTGRGAHGAYPHLSVDPINIGVNIYLALQELIARESDPSKACALTVGSFRAGSAANIIPENAVLEGTVRTNDIQARKLLVNRMKEISAKIAEAYGGTAQVEMVSEIPPLFCDADLVREMVGFIEELPIPSLTGHDGVTASASEDFAVIAEKVPSVFIYLSAGYLDERGDAPAHNPKVMFNEDVLPIGAACLAHCAKRWLESHK